MQHLLGPSGQPHSRSRFNEAGKFPYYCEYHADKGGMGMAGLVVVE